MKIVEALNAGQIHLDLDSLSSNLDIGSNLEAQERVQMLVEAFERGIDKNSKTAIWHGTCLEAVDPMIENGLLPISTKEENRTHHHLQGIYYYFSGRAILEEGLSYINEEHSLTDQEIETRLNEYDRLAHHTWGAVNDYARNQAHAEYVLQKLKLERTHYEMSFATETMTQYYGMNKDSKFHRYAKSIESSIEGFDKNSDKRSFSSEELFETLKSAHTTRKGIVISFKPEIIKAFSLFTGDNSFFAGNGSLMNLPDFYSRVEKGLPIKYIEGIEALGDTEYKFFESLQNI